MGYVAIIDISKKQKIYTKISTEAQIVGVEDTMPRIISTYMFIKIRMLELSPMGTLGLSPSPGYNPDVRTV